LVTPHFIGSIGNKINRTFLREKKVGILQKGKRETKVVERAPCLALLGSMTLYLRKSKDCDLKATN
jgi:hypothetical protein